MNYRSAPKLVNENRPSNAGQDATLAFAYAAREQSAPAQRMFTVQAQQKNGFHPSAAWMEKMANITVNLQSRYRKEQVDKGFILFYKMPSGANTIVIPWEMIMRKVMGALCDDTEKIKTNLSDAYNSLYKDSSYNIRHYSKKYRFREGTKPVGDKKLYNVLSKMTPDEYTSMVSSFSELPF